MIDNKEKFFSELISLLSEENLSLEIAFILKEKNNDSYEVFKGELSQEVSNNIRDICLKACKKSYPGDLLLYGNENGNYYNSYGSFPLKAAGYMSLCQNCFIGTNYPYEFTFTIYYKIGSGEIQSHTFNEEVQIK